MSNPLKIKLDKRSKYLRSLVVRSLLEVEEVTWFSNVFNRNFRVFYDDIINFKVFSPKKIEIE